MLHLYNSYIRKTEEFKPLTYKTVKIYVCGITPYDTTHLGHAFVYVSTDALIRYLTFKGYHVDYTQNVTDIDDDILKRANEEKRDWRKLGDFWTKKFLTDLKNLNVIMPTHYVKATDSIETIIKIVQTLEQKGYAYRQKGMVYFRNKRFGEYGRLSKYTEKQMLLLAKERGADLDDPQKEHPLDFVLWQKSKKNEPFWKSPWGNGRPGWHIECSAMIYDYLGEQIDLHGGGHDLIYPHHESELAQSESFTGKKPFVKNWMHTAMLMYEGEKMSKSLGNLIMVSELLKKYSANAIRFTLLSHHYRKPWDFEEDELQEAEKKIAQMKKHIGNIKVKKLQIDQRNTYLKHVSDRLENDLDTPGALALLTSYSDKLSSTNKTVNENMLWGLKLGAELLGFTL